MVQKTPTDRELLRGQQNLPSEFRQNMILIEFLEPIQTRAIGHFYRIGLREMQLKKGESDRGEEESFYMPEIFQPHRAGVKKCIACGGMNHQRSSAVSLCQNATCGLFRREIVDGPVRGVVDIQIPEDFLTEKEETIPARTRLGNIVGTMRVRLTRGAILVLDRRYPQDVLAAVFRSCHELAELQGWKIKG